MRKFLLFLLLPLCTSLYGQEKAPSLSVGLDQLIFGKGVLDVELISQIVAEKQDELKNTIVSKEILKRINREGCFATRNYAFSVVNLLLEEKNKTVLKKDLLEYSANYAYVFGMAELYARIALNLSDETPLKDILKDAGFTDDQINDFKNKQQLLILYNLKKDNLSAEKLRHQGKGEFDIEDISISNVILDIVYDVSIGNSELKAKGFFQKNMYVEYNRYIEESSYYKYKSLAAENSDKREHLDSLYNSIEGFVEDALKYYSLFERIGIESSDVSTQIAQFQEKLRVDIDLFYVKLDQARESAIRDKLYSIIQNTKDADSTDFAKLAQIKEIKAQLLDAAQDEINKLRQDLEAYESDITTLDEIIKGGNLSEIFQADKFKKIDFKAIENDSLSTKAYLEDVQADIRQIVKNLNAKISEITDEQDEIIAEYDIEAKDVLNKLKERMAGVPKIIRDYTTELKDIKNFDKKFNIDDLSTHLLSETKLLLQTFKLETNKYDSLVTDLFRQISIIRDVKEDYTNFHYVDYLRYDLLPLLKTLNLHTNGKLTRVIDAFDMLADGVQLKIFNDLDPDKDSTSMFFKLYEFNKKINFDFVEFLMKLDHLDEVETYTYLLHSLIGVGDIHSTNGGSKALNTLINVVEKYTTLDQENKQLDFDVENAILYLYSKYGDRDFNMFDFHFTVGLNHGFLTEPIVFDNGEQLNNIGLASEKIGVKFKVFNNVLKQSFTKGEYIRYVKKGKVASDKYSTYKRDYQNNPTIHNVHILLYGSGLLYNLTDLKSQKNFNFPVGGLALGLTAYNYLDFNVGMAYPFIPNQKLSIGNPKIINIGFDIRFSEYLQALNKKRKEAKQLEQIAEIEAAKVTNTALQNK